MSAKISVNKLGEYLEANPTRRKKIVFDQKNPAEFIVARYSKAREIACDFFCSGLDDEILIKGLDDLEVRENTTEFQENDTQNSIEYLNRLLESSLQDFTNLQDFTISKYNGDNPKLIINGVEVSVNPDLIIRGVLRGKKVVGAIKLHFSKSQSLSSDSAKNVATLLHQFVEEYIMEDNEVVKLELCYSIDAFEDILETAPKSYNRRRKNISDACTEIKLWWDNI